jgi:hypothetical protein
MMRTSICLSVYVLIGTGVLASTPESAQTPRGDTLRGPDAFASISDQAGRSRALFSEAAKVIMAPRCMNCHPAGDHPT